LTEPLVRRVARLLRAWMVSQRAGRSLAERNEWATSGGAATNPPEETVIVLASRPDLEGQFAFEDVEGIGVLVVNMRAGYQLAH
jgi:hypothetical protein